MPTLPAICGPMRGQRRNASDTSHDEGDDEGCDLRGFASDGLRPGSYSCTKCYLAMKPTEPVRNSSGRMVAGAVHGTNNRANILSVILFGRRPIHRASLAAIVRSRVEEWGSSRATRPMADGGASKPFNPFNPSHYHLRIQLTPFPGRDPHLLGDRFRKRVDLVL